MNLLQDCITYVRRLIKSPSNSSITDDLIIDYINRFWLSDVDARIQLFDLKTTYQFQTIPGLNTYNMPLYNLQTEPGSQQIGSYPVYQGFITPCYVNGIQVPFYTNRDNFYNLWPNYIQPLTNAAIGDGSTQTFTLSLPYFPAIPGHLDMVGIMANINAGNANQDPYFTNSFPIVPGTTNNINLPTTSFFPGVYITYANENGSNTVVTDSGVFLDSATNEELYGLLMLQGTAPFGNTTLGDYSTTSNTVNYTTGEINVTFPSPPPDGTPIQVQCYFFEQGIPRAILFYNNTITIDPPPNTQYLVQMDGYLSPAAFLNTSQAIPFGYMTEYLARGAARKILSDTGDIEQFQFYEPLFKEQETLVWKRSQRQFTSTRTGTIFSETQGQTNYNNIGSQSN